MAQADETATVGTAINGAFPSKYWRAKAEMACVQLEQMTDPAAIEAMLAVVKNYERLAKITEAYEQASAPRTSSG